MTPRKIYIERQCSSDPARIFVMQVDHFGDCYLAPWGVTA